jgi:hypothetical protein
MIEVHSIAPKLTAANLGKTTATAYDATHDFSDQYIIEITALNKIAAETELYRDINFFRRFPDSPIATVIKKFIERN